MNSETGEVFLDLRGLEPPDPFVRSIEALQHLQAGQYLHLIHTRLPVMLFPELEPRGFVSDSCQDAQQLFHILVWQQTDKAASINAKNHLQLIKKS